MGIFDWLRGDGCHPKKARGQTQRPSPASTSKQELAASEALDLDVKLGRKIADQILPQICFFKPELPNVAAAREYLRGCTKAHDAFSIGYVSSFVYSASEALLTLGGQGEKKMSIVADVTFSELFGKDIGVSIRYKSLDLFKDKNFKRGEEAGKFDAQASGRFGTGAPMQWGKYLTEN